MTQIQVFQCPACGANLSYDGGPETSLVCEFCGTSVIVPEEMRPKSTSSPAPGTAQAFNQQPGPESQGNLEDKIKKELAASATVGDEDPELKELVGMELSQLIDDASQTADARAAQMAQEAVRLASSGHEPEAVNLFREAFPTLSAADAEWALNLMGGGSFDKKAPAGSQPPAGTQPWSVGGLFRRKRSQ
jgi:hypothetical protein